MIRYESGKVDVKWQEEDEEPTRILYVLLSGNDRQSRDYLVYIPTAFLRRNLQQASADRLHIRRLWHAESRCHKTTNSHRVGLLGTTSQIDFDTLDSAFNFMGVKK